MAIISAAEMRVIEEALDSAGGYVLDFTNASFAHFFRAEVGIDIYATEYADGGGSKGKRLRSFLESAPDETAHAALKKLADYARTVRFKPQWRSDSEYQEIFGRFESVIERLGRGVQVSDIPDEPTIWLAKVSRALRRLSKAALDAYLEALERDDRQVPEGTKPLLETLLLALKELLPDTFPASALGNLSRHVHFSERSDCHDIARFDVLDILEKAERFAVALSRKQREAGSERDIANLVDEIFRAKLLATQKSENPDWHALVLQCSVLLVERFKAVTGMQSDEMGAIGKVFSLKEEPVLLVPPNLDTDTNKSLQQGAMLLFQGFRQFIRNPHAHGITDTDEDTAYQMLMLMTLLVNILANAERNPLA
jgi:uncharacterized protein (TIGR02391 family)